MKGKALATTNNEAASEAQSRAAGGRVDRTTAPLSIDGNIVGTTSVGGMEDVSYAVVSLVNWPRVTNNKKCWHANQKISDKKQHDHAF